MAKKKRDSAQGSWMDTYGDMVTLLLTFFVVLFSMSSTDSEKFDQLVQALRGETAAQIVLNEPPTSGTSDIVLGWEAQLYASSIQNIPQTQDAPLPENMDQLYAYLVRYVQTNDAESQQSGQNTVDVNRGPQGEVYITFNNNVLFQPDRYDLLPQARNLLDIVGRALYNLQGQDILTMIKADGYVADTGDPNYAVNDWYLSSSRASSVINYLESAHHINNELLQATGHGINNPVGDNNTIVGRQQNRRVTLTVVGKDMSIEDAINGQSGLDYDQDQYAAVGDSDIQNTSPYEN